MVTAVHPPGKEMALLDQWVTCLHKLSCMWSKCWRTKLVLRSMNRSDRSLCRSALWH